MNISDIAQNIYKRKPYHNNQEASSTQNRKELSIVRQYTSPAPVVQYPYQEPALKHQQLYSDSISSNYNQQTRQKVYTEISTTPGAQRDNWYKTKSLKDRSEKRSGSIKLGGNQYARLNIGKTGALDIDSNGKEHKNYSIFEEYQQRQAEHQNHKLQTNENQYLIKPKQVPTLINRNNSDQKKHVYNKERDLCGHADEEVVPISQRMATEPVYQKDYEACETDFSDDQNMKYFFDFSDDDEVKVEFNAVTDTPYEKQKIDQLLQDVDQSALDISQRIDAQPSNQGQNEKKFGHFLQPPNVKKSIAVISPTKYSYKNRRKMQLDFQKPQIIKKDLGQANQNSLYFQAINNNTNLVKNEQKSDSGQRTYSQSYRQPVKANLEEKANSRVLNNQDQNLSYFNLNKQKMETKKNVIINQQQSKKFSLQEYFNFNNNNKQKLEDIKIPIALNNKENQNILEEESQENIKETDMNEFETSSSKALINVSKDPNNFNNLVYNSSYNSNFFKTFHSSRTFIEQKQKAGDQEVEQDLDQGDTFSQHNDIFSSFQSHTIKIPYNNRNQIIASKDIDANSFKKSKQFYLQSARKTDEIKYNNNGTGQLNSCRIKSATNNNIQVYNNAVERAVMNVIVSPQQNNDQRYISKAQNWKY